jgi:3-hydroxymyristoyl/3-hydroxydecanoyl-(acyl carrier protein) dehydratase
LGAYLGITLQYPDKNLFFRNLDGHGTLSGFQDWRGKTIQHKAVLTTYVALGGSLIQKYDYEMSFEGQLIYKGFASFGFFTKEDLSSQAGLDNGQQMPTWLEKEKPLAIKKFNFALPIVRKLFFEAKNNKPFYKLAGDQLHLLDNLAMLENGGKFNKGYVYAQKTVRPSDWFFTCHFYQDPVMPGSLGVEAIMEAIQVFALQQKIGENLPNPRFSQVDNHKTVWKYRGQILEHDPLMQIEVHIKEIKTIGNQYIILADASLWKGKLRIYEVTDCGVRVE